MQALLKKKPHHQALHFLLASVISTTRNDQSFMGIAE